MSSVGGARYVYKYSLVQPAISADLKFRDDNISIDFVIDESALSFTLRNLSDQQISIAWERASFGVNKQSHPVRNSTTFYSLGHSVPQPLMVPSNSTLQETVIPWQHVNFAKGRWTEQEFFPTHDSDSQQLKGMIEKNAGSEISLLLPIRVGKVVYDYTFVFKVNSAVPVPPDSTLPRRERPPMPDYPVSESSIMKGYLPVIISSGILAIAIIIFTQKKAPMEGL
jgi:hypothetical protein